MVGVVSRTEGYGPSVLLSGALDQDVTEAGAARDP